MTVRTCWRVWRARWIFWRSHFTPLMHISTVWFSGTKYKARVRGALPAAEELSNRLLHLVSEPCGIPLFGFARSRSECDFPKSSGRIPDRLRVTMNFLPALLHLVLYRVQLFLPRQEDDVVPPASAHSLHS